MSNWYLLVGFIVLQRLIELLIARYNTRRLLEEGAKEHGARHYPVIVVLHMAWIASLVIFVPYNAPLNWLLLAVFVVLQLARVWVLLSLGRYWTTRIITVPDEPLVRRGLFRWVSHPNYMVVEAEIIVVPLIAGAWELAVVFGALNALVLAWRIRLEEQALAPRRNQANGSGRTRIS
ncbi:MAG: isoprenylcysteine carboxylmethyltransferase family protein [Alphaproteobacteria bacterium]